MLKNSEFFGKDKGNCVALAQDVCISPRLGQAVNAEDSLLWLKRSMNLDTG
jgi:hypothetical protein